MVFVLYFLLLISTGLNADASKPYCAQPNVSLSKSTHPKITLDQVKNMTQNVDHLAVIMYGDDERLSFTKSELERTAIDGQPMTYAEWITHWLVYLDAKRAGISYGDDEIDKGLNDLQRNNDYSFEMLRNVFKAAGYLWEDVRTHYGAMQVIRTKMEMLMLSNQKALNNATDEEVQAYYKKNPVYQETVYTLQSGTTALDAEKPEEAQLKSIAEGLKKNAKLTIEWQDSYELKESELPANSPWPTLKDGEFLPPKVRDGEIEIKRLVNKTPGRYVPLEDRENEIKGMIRQQKIKDFIDAFHAKLIEDAVAQGRIKFLDESIKKALLDVPLEMVPTVSAA